MKSIVICSECVIYKRFTSVGCLWHSGILASSPRTTLRLTVVLTHTMASSQVQKITSITRTQQHGPTT